MWGEGGEKGYLIKIQDNYMVAARNVKPSISRNLRKNKGLWTECKNEEMQLSENEALWLAKKKKKQQQQQQQQQQQKNGNV